MTCLPTLSQLLHLRNNLRVKVHKIVCSFLFSCPWLCVVHAVQQVEQKVKQAMRTLYAVKWDRKECFAVWFLYQLTWQHRLVHSSYASPIILYLLSRVIGGACWFSSLAFSYREKMRTKYGYEDDGKCCTCFGSLNPYCECMHNACNYPCSFFQIFVALREEEHKNKKQKKQKIELLFLFFAWCLQVDKNTFH